MIISQAYSRWVSRRGNIFVWFSAPSPCWSLSQLVSSVTWGLLTLPSPTICFLRLLNYRYTLITSLWGGQNLWKSLCDPPPPSPPLPPTTALSLSLSLAHTRVQILISPSNLHPFHNISPLFSSPAEQMLAARVSLPLDYTNRLSAFVSLFFFSFSLRSIASFSASSPVKHFLHVPSYLLCDFAADRSFTLSCFALKPSLPLSKHSYLECLPTCAAACSLKTHLLFTTKCFLEYFPPPSWWILSSRSSCRHSSPLLFFFFFFYFLSAVGNFSPRRLLETPSSPFFPAFFFVFFFFFFSTSCQQLGTFHRAVCQKHLHLRFYRPSALFWHSLFLLSFQPSGTSLLLFASLSPGYHTPSRSLSFNVFQDVSRLIGVGCRHPHIQVAINHIESVLLS